MTTFLLMVLPSLFVALVLFGAVYWPKRQFLSQRNMHLALLKKGDIIDARTMTFGFMRSISGGRIFIDLPPESDIAKSDGGKITISIPL